MIVPSQLQVLVAEEQHPSHPPAAPITRRARRHRRHRNANEVSIRTATARDAAALGELEALEGRSLSPGSRLIGELGGFTVAAISVADDSVVADPFEPTAGVVDLLRVRARQLRDCAAPCSSSPRLGLIERLAR